MEFIAIALGLFIGRGWTWVLGSGLNATVHAPAIQLTIYFIVGVATGIAIGEFERRAVYPSGFLHRAAIGFLASFILYPWFLPGTTIIYRRRQVKQAIAYLVASPLVTSSALLAGYIASRPEFSLP
jgi:fluoride ion exporter CrcB/FEX